MCLCVWEREVTLCISSAPALWFLWGTDVHNLIQCLIPLFSLSAVPAPPTVCTHTHVHTHTNTRPHTHTHIFSLRKGSGNSSHVNICRRFHLHAEDFYCLFPFKLRLCVLLWSQHLIQSGVTSSLTVRSSVGQLWPCVQQSCYKHGTSAKGNSPIHSLFLMHEDLEEGSHESLKSLKKNLNPGLQNLRLNVCLKHIIFTHDRA